MKFGKGQSPARIEDDRLITGRGEFTDDLKRPGMAFMAVVRSPHAHADILDIDSQKARSLPGVLATLTFEDIAQHNLGPLPCETSLENIDGSLQDYTERPLLAQNRVRFVGEPVACVIAESLEAATHAAEQIIVQYNPLPAIANIEAAIQPHAPLIWDHIAHNQPFDWRIGDVARVERAFAQAAHVTNLRLVHNRVAPSAMENRAALGEYDEQMDRLTLHTGSQGVHGLKSQLAEIFHTEPEKIRVQTGDVGGGFGMKSFLYPEYLCVMLAAKILRRPVKWSGERSDAFMCDTHGRDMISDASLALDKDGRMLALRVESWANMGAYLSYFGPGIQTVAGGGMIGGVYAIPAIVNRVHGVISNTAPVDAYRGAGRPEAAYITERLVDQAARELGIPPQELRRCNFVAPEAMPYTTALGKKFDVGDFARILDQALTKADWQGADQRKREAIARGKLRGIGMSYYIEITSFGGMREWSRLHIAGDGSLTLNLGTQSNGQGHETAYAQILGDALGMDTSDLRLGFGDSDMLTAGGGTGGSRSVHIGGGAVIAAAQAMIDIARAQAAKLLDCDESALDYRDGGFTLRDSNRSVTLVEIAAQIPGGLDVQAKYKATHPTFPNGCHIAELEIDPETGEISIERYTVVDDFGKLINPMLVMGQVQGGVAQGVGQALMENCFYDPDSAQLVTGSFMDYAIPHAGDLPNIDFSNLVIENPHNELGMKGCGEAGTIGALPAVMNAIADALASRGITHIDMPATPARIWRALTASA